MPRIPLPILMATLVLLLPGVSWGAGGGAIGSYQDVFGRVTVQHPGSTHREPVRAGSPIRVRDRLTTGAGSHVSLRFLDDTLLVVGPHGRVTIPEYAYDPAHPAGGKARFQVLTAPFAFLDGKLAQAADPNVRLDLDLGWIAVRGTKLWRGMRDHQCWIYLESGAVEVANEGGSVALHPGQATRLRSRTVAPAQPTGWRRPDIGWIAGDLGAAPGP